MLWLQRQVMLTDRVNRLQTRVEDQGQVIRRLVDSVAQLQEERSHRLARRSREAADAVHVPVRGEDSNAEPDGEPV